MLKIAMFGQKRIPSREGGVEIVVEELATRMVQIGHDVTCYNRKGHHVSGAKFDIQSMDNYKGGGLWSSSGIIPIPAPRISVGSCRN